MKRQGNAQSNQEEWHSKPPGGMFGIWNLDPETYLEIVGWV
jgi:hypothetical protein